MVEGTLPQRGLTTTPVLPAAERWISFEQLITGTGDLCFGLSARWSLAVEPQRPVYEVNDADDWAALVRRFPGSIMSAEDVGDGREFARETGFWRRRRELAEFTRFEQRVPGSDMPAEAGSALGLGAHAVAGTGSDSSQPFPIPPGKMMSSGDPQARPAESPDWEAERFRLMEFAAVP